MNECKDGRSKQSMETNGDGMASSAAGLSRMPDSSFSRTWRTEGWLEAGWLASSRRANLIERLRRSERSASLRDETTKIDREIK